MDLAAGPPRGAAMTKWTWVAILLIVSATASTTACGDSGTTPTADAGPADVVADVEEVAEEVEDDGPLDDWPPEVTTVPVISQTLSGDLSDGATVDLAWGGQPDVDCWIGTNPADLRGSHVMFALDNALSKTDEIEVTVTPAAGTNVNLYAIAFDLHTYYVPPDVPLAIDCKRSWDAGPGEPESITLRNISAPLEWLIVVAGPEGVETGAFELALVVQ